MQPDPFPQLEEVLKKFREPEFLQLTLRKRFRSIHQTLYELIHAAPSPAFLLGAVVDFFDRINQEKIFHEIQTLTHFEFWLNHFSGLSEQENYETRAKIVGNYLPRNEYQAFFPIGMDRTYPGSHFVAAHLSPDVDTMIASFWGWVDAFAARVGTGLHQWCLPGGPPDSPVTAVFKELFGKEVFTCLPRTAHTLTLTAMDLVHQKQVKKELGHVNISTIDHSHEKVVLLVNEQGHYLGDWHISDVEPVRQITILFKACLHWFENNFQTNLISLFANENLSIQALPPFYRSVFDVQIKECQPALEFNEKQKNDLDQFLRKVLKVEKGLEGTFRDLAKAFDALSLSEMNRFLAKVETVYLNEMFDPQGQLKVSWPQVFNRLKEINKCLDQAIFQTRNYVERLDIVLGVKYLVLQIPHVYLNLHSDVNEMQQKMQNEDFLTVVIHEQDQSLFPVGVVRSKDLREHGLGTVSLRDFCNLEEVRMASYFEVISVVDHHKSTLKTASVPTALIGDTQSCNVLLAELAFAIHDKYSLGGMTPEKIEAQVQEVSLKLTHPSQMRLLQRLLQRRLVAQSGSPFYVHPKREFTQYLFFLYAILDDTDLLTKVSRRDLACVAQLLNRLKSLLLGYETEIIHFDDIPQDKHFVKTATRKILLHPDMHSLYQKIYQLREGEVEANLRFCIEGLPSNIFLDTKEQNGCARIGQTKIFSSNFPYFLQHAEEIRSVWLHKSQEVYKSEPEINLHLHMISTIASANEVYTNQIGPYPHKDELWFWVPLDSQQGRLHLHSFLSGFQYATKDFKETLSLECVGKEGEEYQAIFQQHFAHVSASLSPHSSLPSSMAILRFKAGALNSRKSMVTPYLPRLVS